MQINKKEVHFSYIKKEKEAPTGGVHGQLSSSSKLYSGPGSFSRT